MMRKCAVLLLAMVVYLVGSPLRAEEPHEAWLKFFEGEWTWSGDDGRKGEISFEKFENVPALTSKFRQFDTDLTAISIIGWNPQTRAFVDTGFNSIGELGNVTYDKITATTLIGKWARSSSTAVRSSTVMLRRLSDDKYEAVRPESGEEAEMVLITLERKKQP